MEAGDRIGGWIVERRLGTGGMGSVYQCRNASTDRIQAALKVLDRSLRDNRDASNRFVREAEILAGLDHPNIVRVRNFRIDGDPPYLEMEFVEGEPLDAVISRGPASYTEFRKYLLQMCSAVVYLHSRGVRHRDLKPANILVDLQGQLRIVDFGLATETSLERITEHGLSFGTVSYAPPEWMDPERLDPVQWDLYAIGVISYELLTGRVAYPLSGEGAVKKQLLQVMMHKQVAPPLDPGGAYSDELRALVRRATATEPDQRFANAEALLAAVRTLPNEEATRPLPERRDTPAQSPQSLLVTLPPQRRWVVPAVLGLGVLGAIAGGLVALIIGVGWWPVAQPLAPRPVAAPEPVGAASTLRSVVIRFTGAAPDVPVEVTLDGQTVAAERGVATIADAAVTAGELRYSAGTGCAGCPGPRCPCELGTVAIPEGTDPVDLTVALHPGKGTLVVEVPALAKEGLAKDGKVKRRRRWDLSARLDGSPGVIDGTSARFEGLAAGRHQLVVDVGECTPAAAGCWPMGDCPEKCRSESRYVVIPFEGGERRERMELPLP